MNYFHDDKSPETFIFTQMEMAKKNCSAGLKINWNKPGFFSFAFFFPCLFFEVDDY